MADGGPTINPGMRRTRQRQAVWNALHELGPHHTADEIVGYVRRVSPGFPRSTVYRALDTMVETGDATTCRLDGGALRYEIAEGPHAHAVCTSCGRVFHIDDLAVRVASQELVGLYDFIPQRADLTVQGVCAECRARPSAPAHLADQTWSG